MPDAARCDCPICSFARDVFVVDAERIDALLSGRKAMDQMEGAMSEQHHMNSPTLPWVNAFAEEMEKKLAANRHKGNRDGWRNESPAWLLRSLLCEVGELVETMEVQRGQTSPESRSRIRGECADVANFAMMIADVAGGMKPW